MARLPLRVYEYIDRPYEDVLAVVRRDPKALFTRATDVARARAETVATGLQVTISGISVGADVSIEVGEVEEVEGPPGAPTCSLRLQWRAAKSASLFPTMDARLSLYPISPTETQLDLNGKYEPPAGFVGAVADAFVGHRIAEASVHGLLREVAARLTHALGD